ncbi:MAG: chitobiase/beta-hexosaminidase C-terminal domain-containing protein [Terriglobales bacterium]
MKTLSALVLLATLTAFSLAQIPPAPGMPPVAQAQQAFAYAQAQSMMMTNQAQLQGMIASQAAMLTSVQARSIFLSQAASLQARVAANQGSMFASQAAAVSVMQRSLALQKQIQVQSAILSMRSRGVENASAMQGAVQLASLDPVKFSQRAAMLHAVAAQTSGQTASGQSTPGQTTSGQSTGQTAAQPPSPDAAPLPAEPPPMMIRPTFGNKLGVEKPTFSIKSGTVDAGTKVSIRSDTHYATLYYTTNGWTPTTQSAKYTGPIVINANTHLEVIAVAPNFLRSVVERADYRVPNSPAPVLEPTVFVPEDGILRAGTPVRVAFAGKEIDSESAAVGDEITVVLDEQIKLGETVLAPKGAPVNAALTFADPGDGPAPGDLVFEIHGVDIAGKHVPLFGGETLEGLKGGKNAKITPGMTAMAFVAADTLVK